MRISVIYLNHNILKSVNLNNNKRVNVFSSFISCLANFQSRASFRLMYFARFIILCDYTDYNAYWEIIIILIAVIYNI